MDLYTKTSYALSRQLTLRYSTSFSQSSTLFTSDIRPHIFAIYGLVRIADEVVDTYEGSDKATVLADLEKQVYESIKTGYSTNPILQAFSATARRFSIPTNLIKSFFASMRMDLKKQTYTQAEYEKYIYGSAEVIGLMCLKVFTYKDPSQYDVLAPGAKALGSAYQKINFLRDIASDYEERGRVYFPSLTFEKFSPAEKKKIIKDIQKDFKTAKPALDSLPKNARKAVSLSYAYYSELLTRLDAATTDEIKTSRIRVPNLIKFQILVKTRFSGEEK